MRLSNIDNQVLSFGHRSLKSGIYSQNYNLDLIGSGSDNY